MTGFVIAFVLIGVVAFKFLVLDQYHKDLNVTVRPGTVAWDGTRVYEAGTHAIPNKYEIVDVEERITAFGVDVLGLVSIIDTQTNETTWNSDAGYDGKGVIDKQSQGGRSGSQIVSTRQADNFKNRYIITWKPNTGRLRQYLKSGNIPQRFAELLRTIPDLDMNDYADTLGITVIRWDTPKKRKSSGSVELGDGVEIPY